MGDDLAIADGDGDAVGVGLGVGDGLTVGEGVSGRVGDRVAADGRGAETEALAPATAVEAAGLPVPPAAGGPEPENMPDTPASTNTARPPTNAAASQSRRGAEGATRRSCPRGIVPLRCGLGVERA